MPNFTAMDCPHKCFHLRPQLMDPCPISPPNTSRFDSDHMSCYVNWNDTLYQVHWRGLQQYPDLVSFPNTPGLLIEQVQWSPSLQSLWSSSHLIGFGADAFILCTHTARFPIIKLAQPTIEARQRIAHEYRMLHSLKEKYLSVPSIDSRPFMESDETVGFRLEMLTFLPVSEVMQRSAEVRSAVRSLHEAGFCHGDLTPSNVMQRDDGGIVLIDFGYAGETGKEVAQCIPDWVYRCRTVYPAADEERVERFFFVWEYTKFGAR